MKNPTFKIGITTKRNTTICHRYIQAENEFEALKIYYQMELSSGNNHIGETAKVLPDGMTMMYTSD